MSSPSKKEKALMDHLESIVQRFIYTQSQQGVEVCRKAELRIVEILGKKGSLMMTDVAEQALLSMSTTTSIMDSLVEKGLVQRERSEEDRRVVRVALSAEGRKIFQQLSDLHLGMVRGMLNALNQTEQETLVGLFRKIAEKIENERKSTIV